METNGAKAITVLGKAGQNLARSLCPHHRPSPQQKQDLTGLIKVQPEATCIPSPSRESWNDLARVLMFRKCFPNWWGCSAP